eukprot:TRINITY_DN7591_c0_g1_i1.p1 TRINITY_DN7591_c0_g1~~TRINITY_DN7591_c0_g1_i1.p1  ORF type:complete len:306 (-),score=62.94 TRINITY_DN7591_c0_g1_i1:241-1158(-)
MASAKNDALRARTVEGSINYYDVHRSKGTANEKALAARLGGHSYNIINNRHEDEVCFPHMRHKEHFVDEKNRHTKHFVGERKRKFAPDERRDMYECFKSPLAHPREEALQQRRTEIQLAQTENSSSFQGFQDRTKMFGHTAPPKDQHIHNKLYCNEAETLKPRIVDKQRWSFRRGEPLTHTISCPSLDVTDPAASLRRAMDRDIRKDVSQRQLETAHFAPWKRGSTYANSMGATQAGRAFSATQRHCSVNRMEPYEFAITRKNNHFSAQDKLTRADPFFLPPRHAMTNNSVKYDIINNERRWFKY